ncbi:probable malonyl-CoA-acyl carrier protein transacylase, mitochondrial [Macrosteles quadrilineatus]|uniref:probable malonyl-CoA-acyl carrier protein transacylase, mitochondrial n=1 Tax=Macrosteles quadrilineatus TaxID=74068 RepID=UPI0023E0C51C|nr:probable malonyl-CoA-acyl carrier protein transacylase, mitochondrial [Macrosteles quadrilineatus]
MGHSLYFIQSLLKFDRVININKLNFSAFANGLLNVDRKCVDPSSLLNVVNKLHLCHSNCSNRPTKEDLKSNDVQELLHNAATFEHEGNEELTPDNVWATSPYPKGAVNHRLQSRHSLRPRVDPRETSLILFPGEGSQYVGMVGDLLVFPGVKDIFAATNEILKYNLLSLCMQGPKSKLDETKYAQVAVMVCSFAALEKLREERPNTVDSCIATAGFGVGELTALSFAGAFSFERAVRLAQLRGEAMQTASEMEPGGMLTVMYTPSTKIHEVLAKAKEYAAEQGVEKPVCEVAHHLFPHCKVIAGHIQCLTFIEKNNKSLKINKTRRLNISGAHQTSLMQPAALTFKKYLQRSNVQDPVIAVHSTVTGKIYRNREDILKNLHKQMVKPIKWEQMMHIMYERPVGSHFPTTYEVGPGNTLKTVLKMVNAKAYDSCFSVFDATSV